jgi:PAS domain S-box-containing protein
MNRSHAHQKILIVDDQKANLFALEKILKDVDAEIIQAIDGQTALTQVLDHKFALIILDVRMPGMDGYEVAGHLQGDRSTSRIPIIFVTAEYPDKEHMFKGYEVGAIDYLMKPYSSKILLSKVNILLEMDRNRTELQGHRDALEDLVEERTAELSAANEELQQYSWLLEKEQGIKTASIQPTYADVTALNHDGLILSAVGADTLKQMSKDVMDLLDTSMAIYEINGDYAFGTFVSSWCGTMDNASRALCETDDNQKALNCGKWLCHNSCWKISKTAIDSGKPVDEACCGGLHMYAVPIHAGGQIIGAINFGYGTPPKMPSEQKDLAESYQLDLKILQRNAEIYKPRPPFIINVAKRRLQSIAHLIGEIVERKQTETAFRNIFEMSSDLICVANPSGEYIKVSRSCEKILGYTSEEVMDLGWTQLVHPDDIEATRDKIENQLVGKTTVGFVNRYRHKDGSYKSLEWNAVFSPDGYVYGAARDITERQQAEEALRASEEMMRTSQEVAKICAYSTTLNADEIDKSAWVCSPEFYKIFGIDESYPHTIAGWANFIHPDDRKDTVEYHKSVVKNKKPFNREYRIIRINDGEERWVHGTGKLEFDDKGIPIRMHGAIQDITEQKILGEQFREAQKMESVGRLAGGMAHDFNNMLQVILGFTEIVIDKTGPDSPLADDLQVILKTGLKSSTLIKQLLTFARKEIISPEVINLNDAIDEMLKMLRRLIGENIIFTWQPGAKLHLVRADPSQINQVVANLCINARDAIDGVGEITLKTGNILVDSDHCAKHPEAVPGSYVYLTLSDDGCGMDHETLNNIFEPFFTTKELGKGTGLGLSTVYGILLQNKGFVEVQSEPGKGTEFKIYLPRVAEENPTALKNPEEGIIKGNGETILLVEDESALLSLCTLVLKNLGYKVLAAESPTKALSLFAKHQDDIHLLLTDIILPDMNGKQLVEKIRIVKPDIKVLYMSGYEEGIIAEQSILTNDAKLIAKPFTYAELAEQLSKLLTETLDV